MVECGKTTADVAVNPGQRLSLGVCTVNGRSWQCQAWKGKGSHHHPAHCPGQSAGSSLKKKKKNQINVVGSTHRKNAQQKHFEPDKIRGSKTGKTQGLMHTIWSLEMDTYNLKLITVCLILDI